MAERTDHVRGDWDAGAGVRIATSSDVPGLCCEAATFEELVDIVLALVPDLLAANGVAAPDELSEVPVRVTAERRAVARLMA